MVTRIHKSTPGRLFLKEHRVAHKVSAEDMAGRLGIERESVYRVERGPLRLRAKWQGEYAHALDIDPRELWNPPGVRSLDAMIEKAPDEVRAMAVDIVMRLVQRG